MIAEVKAAGLVGRGGAAFPTGVKWEGAAQAAGQPKYVVCNADEAEPGTFKDRVLMEDDPHRILEGLIIAAYAIGAARATGISAANTLMPYEIVRQAVNEARQAGYLGRTILGSDFHFDLELRRGAGAYICGEETALFESIEGKRGFPRVKPPFPTTHGLFGQPTVINNVETLANVPLILQDGRGGLPPDRHRKIARAQAVLRLRRCGPARSVRSALWLLLSAICWKTWPAACAPGTVSRRPCLAALPALLPPTSDLDTRLTFEDLRAAGLPLGSGVITVFDETRDLRDILLRLAPFLRRGILRQMLSLPDRHPAPVRNPAARWLPERPCPEMSSACRMSAGR